MIAASIIVPCFNQLEFTGRCLRALFRHTRPAFELMVIDNGSTDGTGMYLASVQDASPVPVTVFANGTNRGFPAAVNQGLRVARGEYLVLLNNDAVVTDSWLDQLIALANAESGLNKEEPEGQEEEHRTEGTTNRTNLTNRKRGIGLVGPMSDYASPPQLVENVPYWDMEEMQAFARRWRDERRGQWFTAGKLSGFCLLVKRAVYEAIGGLDERFGLGFFDDDDLAIRARRAGFELAVAHDLFIHHFGSRTFAGNGIDAEALLQENGRKFHEKWGTVAGNGHAITLKPGTAQGSQHTPPVRKVKCLRTVASRRIAQKRIIPRCHQVLGDLPGALAVCSEGLSFDPGSSRRSCATPEYRPPARFTASRFPPRGVSLPGS